MTTVKMLRTAQTGAHIGRKGKTVTVPDDIAANWIALGIAEPVNKSAAAKPARAQS